MQLPQGRRVFRPLEFFQFGGHASDHGHDAQQHSGNTAARTLFLEIFGAACIGFGGGQREIEEPHGDHLAEFRVGHAHEYPDGFLNLADLGLFG